MSEFFAHNPWAAILLGGVVGFLIGLIIGFRYAEVIRATVASIGSKEPVVSGFSRRVVLVVVGVWVALAVVVGYTTVRGSVTDARQDKELAASVERNTVLTKCLSRLSVQITETTATRSKASKETWASLVAAQRAMVVVLTGRVKSQQQTSDEIQQAADQFIYQSNLFFKAYAELDETWDENPTPEFRDFCPKVEGTQYAKGEPPPVKPNTPKEN